MNSLTMEVERGKSLLDELANSVDSMKSVFSTSKSALTDDHTALQTFCLALETALRHGQKERSSLFGGNKDYWQYFKAGLADSRTFFDILQSVHNQPDVKTPVGQGRAFLRLCLADGCLADAVQLCTSGNPKLTNESYKPEAILRNELLVSRFLDIAYSLSEIQFTLGISGLNLDQAWPTFAKKVFVGQSPPRTSRSSKPRKAKAAMIADSGSENDEPLNDSPGSGFIPRQRQGSRAADSQDSPLARRSSASGPSSGMTSATTPAEISSPVVAATTPASQPAADTVEPATATPPGDHALSSSAIAPAALVSNTADEGSQPSQASQHVVTDDVAITSSSAGKQVVDGGDDVTERAASCHLLSHTDREKLIPLLTSWLVQPGSMSQSHAGNNELEVLRASVVDCRKKLVDEVTERYEAKTSELSAESDRLSQRCSEQASELEAAKHQLGSLHETIDELKRSHQAEVERLSEKHSQAELQYGESLRAVETDLADVRTSLRASEATSQQLAEEKESFHEQAKKYDTFQMEMDTLQLQVRSHSNEADRYKQELTSLREASKREAEEWRDRMASTERHHQQQLSAAQQRSRDLTEQLHRLSTQLTSMTSAETSDNEGADVSHETLRKSSASSRPGSFSDDHQDLMGKIQFQLSAQTMQLKHANQELNSKKQEVETLQFELLQVKQRQDVMEAAVRDAADSKESLLRETTSLSDQVCVLTDASNTLKSEITSLENQLVSSNKDRDMERVTNLKLNTQVEQMQSAIKAVEAENDALGQQADSTRDQLLQVTRQKATLMNRQATLEEELSTMGKKQWIEDDQVQACMYCAAPFTLFNRRHHCRSCGGVFCTTCCDKTYQLPASNKPSRVCIPCYERLTSTKLNLRSDIPSPENFVVVSGDKASPGHQPPVTERRGSDERLARHTAGGQIVLGDSGDEMEGQDTHPKNGAIAENMPETSTVAVSTCNLATASSGNVALAAAAVAETVTSQSFRRQASLAALKCTDQADADSDIAYTSHMSKSSQSLQSRRTSKSGTPTRKPELQVLEMIELPIKAGCYHTIPVLIEQPGSRISWQFQTDPKGIAFGIAFAASEVGDDTAATTLVPLRRTGSHKQMVNGDWVARSTGIYTLQFDNTSSTMTPCRISYRVVITPAD
ncbi:FYVE and coiled-coil domain-containing protein 1-like isoform X2 [Sycon ciliatum]|uniref:FYVE and coiled-coil domain-containing protein 1-like isoform X2 n=1 Tax=Sycon ciliatum TaxID=27933 RepID=UPI0031F6F4E6|eukprot:scpid25665/ scgid6172/ FYVE and coiled-coil domain-containing protein 1; Zinc finger FYVE domain-containing protein 7